LVWRGWLELGCCGFSDNGSGAYGTLKEAIMGRLACGCLGFVDNSGVVLVMVSGV